MLEVLLQKRRAAEAANAFFVYLLGKYDVPKVIPTDTDKLWSCGAAQRKRSGLHTGEHVQVVSAARGNKLVEQSHRQTRQQERSHLTLKRRRRAQELPALHARVLKPFSPVDPVDALVVHGLTFTAQHQVDPPVSESRSFPCQRTETLDQALGFPPFGAVSSLRRPREAQYPASLSFADSGDPLQHGHSLLSEGRLRLGRRPKRHHFRPTTSFSVALSSDRSATSFFNR
ncbi:IS6 family transposase [Deinococcus sp. SDU3-2]|uniref:IS6 family transposase n=1 Tax=Deinococcus terrestris TaxID=2651870 RepID=A0A7X1NVZ0_9DEIO|nr:IS6 family transposase [Deinococcus terrestris]